MSSVKNKDTDLEVCLRSGLHRAGFRFTKHVRSLPGSPDLVFSKAKVAVFIDGDFWHGYRFREWKHSVSDFWRSKIETNRRRDARNFRQLRRMGWIVMRIWGHELKQDTEACIDKIAATVQRRRADLG